MKKIVNRLRHLYHQLTFVDNFRMDLFQKLLGHHKVIGYEDGDPVHTLFVPAFLGNQYRSSMVGVTVGQITNRQVPVFADIAITETCDARCPHCYFSDLRKSVHSGNALSKEVILNSMKEMQSMGINSIAFVGGEPLLYPDLTWLIRNFDKQRTNLLLFTNGNRLPDMAKKLARAGLKRMYVSIDYADRDKHDQSSGKKGIFDNAIKGIIRAKKAGILTGFSTTILSDTTVEDLRGVFKLAQKLGVAEIYLNQTINPNNCIKPVCPDDEFFAEVKKVNGNPRYKFGVLYYPFFSSRVALGGCTAGGTRLYVGPDGQVTGCDVLRRSFGNIKEESIFDIWYRMVNTPGYGDAYGKCRYGCGYQETQAKCSPDKICK